MSSEKINYKRFLLHGPGAGDMRWSANALFPEFEIRAIETAEELKICSQLVYNEYLATGYARPNLSKMKLSLFSLLPTTKTFVAILHGRIVATVTLVEDSPLGLPMESLFHKELTDLRLDDRRIVEFSMLAMDRQYMKENSSISSGSATVALLCHIFRAMFDYIRMHTNIDVMVECCHPTHDSFYRKICNMEMLGTLRHYGAVNGNPAVARWVDLPKILKMKPADHGAIRLYFRDLPTKCHWNRDLKLTQDEVRHLFVESTNVLQSAHGAKLNFLKSSLPHIDFDALISSRDIFSYLVDSLDQRSYIDDKKAANDL